MNLKPNTVALSPLLLSLSLFSPFDCTSLPINGGSDDNSIWRGTTVRLTTVVSPEIPHLRRAQINANYRPSSHHYRPSRSGQIEFVLVWIVTIRAHEIYAVSVEIYTVSYIKVSLSLTPHHIPISQLVLFLAAATEFFSGSGDDARLTTEFPNKLIIYSNSVPLMEARREVEDLLDKIQPPRLEDAGLEDCALPPESIHEAFLKAASAVGSRAASIPSTDDNLWPNDGESSDTVVEIKECVAEKGGGDAEERVEVAEMREEEGCVEGLKIREDKGKKKNDEEKESK